MFNFRGSRCLCVLTTCCTLTWLGCTESSTPPAPPAPSAAHTEEHGHDHGHSHSADDALVWGRTDIETAGCQIKLGHHSQTLHAGEAIEPAVSIMRGSEAVADAKVFNALIAAEGGSVLAAEVPTVYEPETADEPAHYAQGDLQVPLGTQRGIIRFRIALVGESVEQLFDLPISFVASGE